jgi:ABC-type uncharacterized transport system fused permease/ATPase subunit
MAAPGRTDAARIASIAISDFRAFPALAPAAIAVDGKNLLAWGENGSGKSSIYRALRGLFSVEAQDAQCLQQSGRAERQGNADRQD